MVYHRFFRRHRSLIAAIAAVYGLFAIPLVADDHMIRAFPEAEGFGAYSIGGRGGRVIEVTNLDDSGPGSFRDAVTASGPRIVVFRVGGTIALENELEITNSYLTVAGQTAPGGGITIKSSYAVSISAGESGTFPVTDIVIRNLRFRNDGERANMDILNVLGAKTSDVIIDHVSASWGTDEVLSVAAQSHQVTIQWSIISEAKSKATLVSTGAREVTLHHNLWAHNGERNPKLKGRPELLNGHPAIFDFVNNVVYNWEGYAAACAGSGMCNLVANFFKLGPSNHNYPERREIIRLQGEPGRSLYVTNNIGPSCPNGCSNDWEAGMVSDVDGNTSVDDRSLERHQAPLVTTQSADDAYSLVLAGVGASQALNCDGTVYQRRDSVDDRVLREVQEGTGKLITHPSEVGGFPPIAPGTPCTDYDRDGMADEWERLVGLDPANPLDGNMDADNDGYTNIEEFLNGTPPTPRPSPPQDLRLIVIGGGP